MAKPLDDVEALGRVSREVVAACLDLTLRNFHHLVARGVLPAPVGHGVYSLPDCLDAYLVYRAKVDVPSTLLEADQAVELAERARRVYLRRERERRLAEDHQPKQVECSEE